MTDENVVYRRVLDNTDPTVLAFALLVVISLTAGAAFFMFQDDGDELHGGGISLAIDPLPQDEDHDHRNATEHEFQSDNMELVSFNPLTKPGNAEIQVFTSPGDGRTYVYQAGWSGFHIIDVTDPTNTTVTAWYNDPNTQVLDVKYLTWNNHEYVIIQNQIIDAGAADPNVGDWNDPIQVSVTLVDVTDKTNPQFVDYWYDFDHPSGPHNLYTYMIDGEWYLFIANPEYEECDIGTGEACGGVSLIHVNFEGLPGPRPDAWHIEPMTLVKVGEFEVNWETTRGGWIYIHDLTVQKWPDTDVNDPRFERTYIYGAYWEAGLRIGDVSDIPHPQNSPLQYLYHAVTCRASGGTAALCNWRAPEVGAWMDFADLDGDGEPDSGTTGNENGGRSSYIHYAEPYPEMVDASHLGLGEKPRHMTFLATEVLETTVGTGLGYLLDTTDYEMVNGMAYFKPKLLSSWENPHGEKHFIPGGEEWLLFSPHNVDIAHFEHEDGTWDGRIYMGNYHTGLWILDVETLMSGGGVYNSSEMNAAAVAGYYLPHGADGTPLDSSFYDFGWTPFLWTAEYYKGYIYLSCITSGLYIVQLDLDAEYVGIDG